jgi:hypothetical protein
MKFYLSSFSLAVLAAALQTLSAAEITGKVTLKGQPKPETPVPLEGTTCGPVVHVPLTTRHYVVGADKGLANVFVYVKQGAAATPPAAGEGPILDQINCQYEPYVMGMVTNQKLKIRNSDPLLHNVHATPKVNKEFNFAQVTKGQVNEKTFDKAEVLVRMKCDVHPWMFAYIGVVDHPYFGVTDKDGSFKISNLPAGKYTIEAVHLKAGNKQQEITVTGDEKKAINFELEVPAAP